MEVHEEHLAPISCGGLRLTIVFSASFGRLFLSSEIALNVEYPNSEMNDYPMSISPQDGQPAIVKKYVRECQSRSSSKSRPLHFQSFDGSSEPLTPRPLESPSFDGSLEPLTENSDNFLGSSPQFSHSGSMEFRYLAHGSNLVTGSLVHLPCFSIKALGN